MFEVLGAKIYRALFLCNKKYEQDKYRKKYDIDPSVRIGDNTLLYDDGKISIGEGTYIGSYCRLQSNKGNRITIGRYCAISHFVRMHTTGYATDHSFNIDDRVWVSDDIVIGDNCWICACVSIKQGVTIGDNVVIGANSVVTKDVPSFAIVGGCPAKIIRYKKNILVV